MEPISLALLSKLVAGTYSATAKLGFLEGGKKLAKAISLTASDMSAGDADKKELEKQLEVWCQSLQFIELEREVKTGAIEMTPQACVRSFELAGIHFDEAERIAEFFIANLFAAELGSDNALNAKVQTKMLSQILDGVKELCKKSEESSAQFEISQVQESDARIQGSIDVIENLIETQQIAHAFQELQTLSSSERFSELSTDARFLVSINLGVCAFKLGHLEKANECFQDAVILKPLSARAQCNYANSLFLSGNIDKSSIHNEKALRNSPSDPNALALKMLILMHLNAEELDTLIEEHPEINENSSTLLALGQILLNRHQYRVADEKFGEALKLDPTNSRIPLLRAKARFLPPYLLLKKTSPFEFSLSGTMRQEFENAISFLDQHLALVDGEDFTLNKVSAYTNRAGIKMLLGDVEGSLADLDKALSLESDNPESLINKGRALMILDRNSDAREALTKVKGNLEDAAKLILLEVEYRQEHFTQALQIAEDIWQNSTSQPTRLSIVERLIELNHVLKDSNSAQLILSEFCVQFPEEQLLFKISQYSQLKREGNLIDALKLMYDVRNQVDAPLYSWVSLDIARCLVASNQRLAAHDEYQILCAESVNESLWCEYIRSLLERQLYDAALTRATTIRQRLGKIVLGATEIEAQILCALKRFDEAETLFVEMSNCKPCFVTYFNLFRFQIGRRQMEKARDTLAYLQRESIPPEQEEQFTQMKSKFIEEFDLQKSRR